MTNSVSEVPDTCHDTAVVDADAKLDPTARIGPYSIIGPGVRIGARVQIGPHVLIERDTTIGADCQIKNGAVLGTDPQDQKYAGEQTLLEVGQRTVIREFATLNRGTAATGRTCVGDDALIMAYAHVAHDCRIGNHAVIANAVNMAGHVEVGDWAIIGGMSPIHQFTRIGQHAMVGGAARVLRDVAPFTLAGGIPTYAYGINRIGLERRGFDSSVIRSLREAFRDLFRSGQPLDLALARVKDRDGPPEVAELVAFVARSERGLTPTRVHDHHEFHQTQELMHAANEGS